MSGGETRCTTCGVQLIDRDHRPWCENRVRRTAEVYLPDPPAAVFTAASRFVRRFVSTHKHAQHVAVLWVAHCHAIDAFYTTPRIRIESPQPECGKTVFLDVLGRLLPDPITDVSITPSALYRTLEKRTPAVLLDEVDKTLARKGAGDSETLSLLLAIANSGYRRGWTVTRCAPRTHEPTQFPTFASMALAGLNAKMDAPFMTRSITLEMERALPSRQPEPFEWGEELAAACEELRDEFAAWAASHVEQLRSCRPERPDWMTGRAREVWEPLLRVANVVGGPWPRRLLEAGESLVRRGKQDNATLSVAILGAGRTIFGDRARIFSTDLLIGLNALEDAPWASWNDGAGLRPIDFTNRVVRHFKLHHSQSIRIGDENRKGYEREWFEAAWRRYLPCDDPTPVNPGRQPVTTLMAQRNQPNPNPSQPTDSETPEPLQLDGCDDVTGNGGVNPVTDLESDPRRFINPDGFDHTLKVARDRAEEVRRQRAHPPRTATSTTPHPSEN